MYTIEKTALNLLSCGCSRELELPNNPDPAVGFPASDFESYYKMLYI